MKIPNKIIKKLLNCYKKQASTLSKEEQVVSYFNFTPAPNARSVIMVAQYQDREYKSLCPPLVINPLDPKLPTQITDWQENIKDF